MEKHRIVTEIEALKSNREKVQKFFDLKLNPQYGLSQELTILMYDLYAMSSGDTYYQGRYNCGACQMTIWRKLSDFLNYGDNLGKPLINWEVTKKSAKKNSNGEINNGEKKKSDNDNEDRVGPAGELE